MFPIYHSQLVENKFSNLHYQPICTHNFIDKINFNLLIILNIKIKINFCITFRQTRNLNRRTFENETIPITYMSTMPDSFLDNTHY